VRLALKDLPVKINPDLNLYQPGSSSDRAAVRTAIRHGAKRVVNLSNISHVYTADPREDKTAEKIETISWADFRKIIPDTFTPNLSSPFDPEAAKEAEANSIEVATISGENLAELPKYLAGETFVGTKIS
jgi:uridylate kinase